ncbi:hypothetical protein A3715_10630 [Oleiphilus sp. HI0009]|nr:hypothetical protein A3715_10630 [Oleiphilus sp. HI0009]
MELKPKALEKGWEKRTLKNAIELIKRHPGWWFVLYVGFPILNFYSPNFSVGIMLISIAMITGTFLCFRVDHLSKTPASSFIAVLLYRPSLIVLTVATIAFSNVMAINETFKTETVIDAYLNYGLSFILLHFSALMSTVTVGVLLDIPRMIWFLIKERRGKTEQDKELMDLFCGRPFPFTLHLVTDTQCKWMEASELSEKGFRPSMLGKGYYLTLLSISLVMICPILLGLIVPWFYCIYRELFWQEGITKKEKKQSSITSAVPESA